MARHDLIARAAELEQQTRRIEVPARPTSVLIERAALTDGLTARQAPEERVGARRYTIGEAHKSNSNEVGQRPSAPRTNIQSIDWGQVRLGGGLVPNSPPSRITEEFRIIKRPLIAHAFRKSADRSPRDNIIMVTSARPLEGKTYLAINLAMSLASERDLNVLLIDADCHRPTVLERLGLKAERGLMDVLQDSQLNLADVIIRTDCPNLSVVPGGRRVSESTEILASHQMEELMNEIASRYGDRLVVIDTPPVLATSEASVLARLVGQVLFVVEANNTGASTVQEACAFLSACSNLSIVLNKRISRNEETEFGSYYY